MEYIINSKATRTPEDWCKRNSSGQIVRCRDCKNARIKYTAKGTIKSASCSWHGRCIHPDGYCAWGVWSEDA